MSKQNPTPPIEAWELTAYLLGELDHEHSQLIRKAVDTDRALATELAEIKQTIGVVQNALEVDDAHAAVIARVSESGSAVIASSSGNFLATVASTKPPHRSFTGRWIALLAMSACLLVAVVYSSGSLNDWLNVGRLVGQRNLAELHSESEMAEVSTSIEGFNQVSSEPKSRNEESRDISKEERFQIAESTFPIEDSGPSKKVVSDQDDILFDPTNSAELSEAVGPGNSVARAGSEGVGGMGMGMGRGMGMGMSGGSKDMGDGGMGMGMGMGDMGGMGGMGGAVMGGMGGMGGGSMEIGMGGMGMGMGGMGMEGGLAEGYMGMGPGMGTVVLSEPQRSRLRLDSNSDRYQAFSENQFELVDKQPLSTFSIDVDTASYAKCRQLLMEAGQLPPASAVRLEEFVNYFDYDYAAPTGEHPFATHLAVTNCPWQPEHKLVRVALQTTKPNLEERNPANVVFLIDVSGSMSPANKLPLVKDAMRMMIERLNERDRVAMVVYAGAAGCVLEGTSGSQQATILAALDRLQAGGSTNGGDGIQLAYQLARDQFIPGGNNRVVLCTDGDFNVGVTGTEQLVDIVAQNAKSKIFLTVLGFGMGNTNDAMMEQISNRGNGVYGFVDSWREAKRQMVDQLAGNLITVAKDVKIQVEFNPQHVQAYRLLGYENRVLAAKDFNDDTKDAGEIGAGHRVTALYEVVPVGVNSGVSAAVDDLLFQPKTNSRSVEANEEKSVLADEYRNAMMAVKLRYKQPEGDVSQKLVVPLENQSVRFQDSDRDFRWAASMVQFGMLLRSSQFAGNSTWSGLLEQAREAAGSQPDVQREEALQMMERASRLK